MKKISLASSILMALSMQAYAEPGKEGDKWIAGFAEYYSTDQEVSGFPNFLNDGTGLGAEFGFRFTPQWAGRIEYSSLDINVTSSGQDKSGNRFGFDAMYFLPNDFLYVFGGIKEIKIVDSNTVYNFGMGKQWNVADNVKVITEVSAYNDFENGYNDIGVKVGLAYTFGDSAPAAPKDSDKDGVYDDSDMCANTPVGTRVDATGCDVDTDKDGVVNTLDLCPATPLGTKVDSNGCNEDLDGDGVLNNVDACPDTPAGSRVGAKGCRLELDSDEDGILDANDQCANTPVIDKVDSAGCSIFTETEVNQTLNVTFAKNSSEISDTSSSELQEFAAFMKRYPNTDTVIEGHASAPGSAAYNLEISQKRAEAVRRLLITQYGIDAARIATVGFGETQLLDTANTAQAHAKNRRIVARVSASKREKVLKN